MVLIMVVEKMKAKMGKGKRVFGYLEVSDLFTVLKLLNKPTIAVRESTKLYLILTTPRTGSTLLCESLKNTKLLGRPAEWLEPALVREVLTKLRHPIITEWEKAGYPDIVQVVDMFSLEDLKGQKFYKQDLAKLLLAPSEESWKTKLDLREYMNRVIRGTMTSNGVFGMKVHVGQYLHWLRHGLDLFDLYDFDAVYSIDRQDKIAQAYSRAMAEKTGFWKITVKDDIPVDIPITPTEVAQELFKISKEIDILENELVKKVNFRNRFKFEELIKDNGKAATKEILNDLSIPVPLDFGKTRSNVIKQSGPEREKNVEGMRKYFNGEPSPWYGTQWRHDF